MWTPSSNRVQSYLLVTLAAMLMVFRHTRYFTEPRFWAEEGSQHFAFAYNNPWWQALLQPHKGYLSFWPNLATTLATVPPLELAPLVTTLMALGVQLLPVVIIVWSRSPIWDHWVRKLAGVAVAVFSPLTMEVWLNTANSYNYFAAIAFLLLLECAPRSTEAARRWGYRMLLLIAGLSGLSSTFLIPLFAIRALGERRAERWRQVGILSACAALHLLLVFSVTTGPNIHARMRPLDPAIFGTAIWTQTIGLFAVGEQRIAGAFREIARLIEHDPAGFQSLGWFLLAAGLALMFVLSSHLLPTRRLMFITGYLVLMFLPILLSDTPDRYAQLAPGNAERTYLAPNMIFGWMLLAGIQFPGGGGWRVRIGHVTALLCLLLVSASIAHGMLNYRFQPDEVDYWPNWSAEVEAWRADPSYPLRIQPETWVVPLSGGPYRVPR